MAGNARQVINMANSIVGVSILSMPFCFKESGLLLGVVLVLVTGFITKKTCMFLIRSAIMARRRSYEFLAFHVFGVSGKLFVEMCMILFLFGICISFYVVMGDIAPAIVARFMNIENSSSLRYTLLIGIAVLVILPLCLLRNLDNLASMSAFSIMFYFFLVVVIFWHAFPKLWDGTWIHMAELWRPAGALQVLPILSLALACQSNVFEIYDSVPDPDVPKMRFVVNHAVNLCSALYISVGFLGYVAFVDKDFGGNIIMSFPDSGLTEGIKMFFAVSLAISFPLMIFPCRTSIHSLLYRRSNPSSFDLVGNYMPESRFKAITVGILFCSLVIGILIPSIELVLGLLGSTMGMLIATILPSLLFIKVNTKASTERLLAQGIMLMGLMLIVTGTYLNIAHIREVQEVSPSPTEPQIPKIINVGEGAKEGIADPGVGAEDTATRKEPVAPEPPPEENESLKKENLQSKGDIEKIPGKVEEKDDMKSGGNISNNREKKIDNKGKTEENTHDLKNEGDTLHPDAIKKEEKENEEEKDKTREDKDIEKKQEEILEKMEVQRQEQQQILEEQKKILKELKDHKLKQEEEDAKKQEESKTKNTGVGNVLVVQESQILDGNNPGLQAGMPQGVDSLVGNQLKPSLNQNDLQPNALPIHQAESNVQHPKKSVNVGNLPNQNLKFGEQPLSIPISTGDKGKIGADQPVVDLGVKINHQLPLAYYHANLPNPVVSAPLPNDIVDSLPAGNQVPAEKVAEYAQANIPGQQVGNPGQHLTGNVIQPLQSNIPQQASGVVQSGNVPLQPAQAYVQAPPAQAMLSGQQPMQMVAQVQPVQDNLQGLVASGAVGPQLVPAAAAAMPGQSKPIAGVPGQQTPIVGATGQQAPGAILSGEQKTGAIVSGQQAVLPSVASQQASGVVVPGHQILAASVPGQPAAAVVGQLPGQQAPAASGPGQPTAAVVGQVASAASVPGQQIPAASVPGQQVPAVSVPVQLAHMGIPNQHIQPNLLVQPAQAGLLGQSLQLNVQEPGVSQLIQGNVPFQTLQESVPVQLSQSNLVGQPGLVANPPGNGAHLDSARQPVAVPDPLSHSDDKSKLDHFAGKPQPSLKTGKEKESKQEKKKSLSGDIKEISKKLETSKIKNLKKKTEKTVSKKLKLTNGKKNDIGEISGQDKSIKKTQHDEERRKRDVVGYSNLDLPQTEILKELKWKEFGDVMYDTRHLLWTGRSRRKKRNKGRDEEYYWDET